MADEKVDRFSNEDIRKRLNRIEGQIKGIKNMLDSEKACTDILTQVAAVRAAINKVGGMILANYSKKCLNDVVSSDDRQQALEELNATIQSFLKFVD